MIVTRQSTLASGGFDAHGKTTRKAAFVARMDKLMPWSALLALIEPHYPKAGNGRPPRSMSSMLRMYCIANWFNLADECHARLSATPPPSISTLFFAQFDNLQSGKPRKSGFFHDWIA
jgi:hypothetical protein